MTPTAAVGTPWDASLVDRDQGGKDLDPLYVVELDIQGDDPTESRASIDERLVAHTANWLSRNATEPIAPSDLSTAGRKSVHVLTSSYESERVVRWEVSGAGDVTARQITVAQDLQHGTDGSFICAVTLYRDDQRNVMRVEMGREVASGRLTPIPVSFLRRPGLIGLVLGDGALIATAAGQPVTGRYEFVDDQLAAVIPEVMKASDRLPLLVVDSRAKSAQDFCRRASRELAGLVQVVALTPRAVTALAGPLDEAGAHLPPGGARLIWPDLGARHPDFTAEQIGAEHRAVNALVRMVAPLSVAARGQNRLLRIAASAMRSAAQADFRSALNAARSQGNTQSELSAFQRRVEELDAENIEWMSEVERLEKENAELRNSQAEAQYWREQAQAIQSAQSSPSGARWDEAPECDPDDLTPLSQFLEQASGGCVVFTAAAARSWRRCGYPHADAMGIALTGLAQAATEWKRNGCSTRGLQMDDWFKTSWGLNFAITDKGLSHAKADTFDFEGTVYSRQPHLKLDDHTSPNQVGRVYFAIDPDNERFIVDHVGLKLYGL